MLKTWKTLTREILHENPWWKYAKDTFETGNGTQGEYYYVDSPGSVMIVPVQDDGRIVMVNQYRHLNGRESLELPGGGVKPGVDPQEMAKRELREEAGVEADSLVEIGAHNPFNGVTNEICRVFIARGLRCVPSEADATEEFEIHHFTEAEIDARIADGSLWDGMSLAAWSLYKLRKGDI